jgi:hypothetical protein
MAARTGKQYLAGLKDDRCVWVADWQVDVLQHFSIQILRDWIVRTPSLAARQTDFEALIEPLHEYMTGPSRPNRNPCCRKRPNTWPGPFPATAAPGASVRALKVVEDRWGWVLLITNG